MRPTSLKYIHIHIVSLLTINDNQKKKKGEMEMEKLGDSNGGKDPHPVVGEEGHPALVKEAPLDPIHHSRPALSLSLSIRLQRPFF